MANKYRLRYRARKLSKKSKRNFFISIFLIIFVMYIGLVWVLPFVINGISTVKSYTNPVRKPVVEALKNSSLAPPVLNIPFEATNTALINIKGFATSNSKVAIFLDDEKKDTVDVSSEGNFEFKDISLVLGTNNIYGKSIDENNIESFPSKTLKIIFDNEKPSLTLNEPEDGKTIQGGDKKVKISGKTEPGIRTFINNSQIIIDKDGNFSLDQPLNEGDNTFIVTAVDNAGNSTEVSRKVIYQP